MAKFNEHMAPRSSNGSRKDNLELILYRLDELRDMFDHNSKQQADASAAAAKAHRENTIAIVKLESKVKELEKDFIDHFDKKVDPVKVDWAKGAVAVLGVLATVIALIVAVRGN